MRLLTLFSVLFSSFWAMAQSSTDAFLWANELRLSTTRSMSLSNALGASDDDLSVLLSNPAALALGGAPSLTASGGLSTGSLVSSQPLYGLCLGALGVSFSIPLSSDHWDGIQLGASYQQLNGDYALYGYDTYASSDLLSVAADQSAGLEPAELDPAGAGLLYRYGMLDYDAPTRSYRHINALTARVERFGRQMGLTLAGATRYQKKLSFGIALTLPFLDHRSNTTFQDGLSVMSLTRRYAVRGTGWRLLLGTVYQVHDRFRLGASIQTPTSYRLYQEGTTRASSGGELTQTGVYQLRTYWQYRGSFSWAIGPKSRGLFVFEVGGGNPSTMRYQTVSQQNSAGVEANNDDIARRYQGFFDLRVAMELPIGRAHYRIGYVIQTSSYATTLPGLRRALNLGLGWKWDAVQFDLGLRIDYMHAEHVSYFGDVVVTPNYFGFQNPVAQLGFRFALQGSSNGTSLRKLYDPYTKPAIPGYRRRS